MSLNSDQLHAIAPNLREPKLSIFAQAIDDAMYEFEISTPQRQAAFLAQLMHESGECRYVEELASGRAYEGREDLGNIYPGDGVRFKGRGLIQLTGRANYALLSEAFGIDLITNPELLEQPDLAARSAAWFWKSRGLNELADLDTDASFRRITKRVNGGYNGEADRIKYWVRAKDVFYEEE